VYLNLDDRLAQLNSRLDRLDSLFSLCRDVLNTSYGHRLELIVIWLIVIEVAISIIELTVFIYGAEKM
jgi:required for meiotic nuclear division protein 1